MPREWAREPFYTFINRERMEGLGDAWATTGQLRYKPSRQWLWEVTVGYATLPDPTHARLNKYGLPSYTHLNARARYDWKQEAWNLFFVAGILVGGFAMTHFLLPFLLKLA